MRRVPCACGPDAVRSARCGLPHATLGLPPWEAAQHLRRCACAALPCVRRLRSQCGGQDTAVHMQICMSRSGAGATVHKSALQSDLVGPQVCLHVCAGCMAPPFELAEAPPSGRYATLRLLLSLTESGVQGCQAMRCQTSCMLRGWSDYNAGIKCSMSRQCSRIRDCMDGCCSAVYQKPRY